MSDGMGREPAYLSSHATNRYFIPNWGIILLLIEWIFISHKKCSINATVFVGYSFPLYYLMIYKGTGGAAFTWWFYLVLFTSIHVIILLIIFFHFFRTTSRRRANERKQRCDKWNEGCAFFWVTLAYGYVIFPSLWPSILQMVYIGTPASSVTRLANECRHEW